MLTILSLPNKLRLDTLHSALRSPRKPRTKSRLKLATLNMRGYGRASANQISDKWLAINQIIRDGKIAVLALQEAHLTDERVEELNTLFEATMAVIALPDDQNPTGARGVAFTLNKRLVDTGTVTRFNLLPGRALAIQLNWTNGRRLTLLNVYAHNHMPDNAAFWLAMHELLTRQRAPKIDIMMGDLNMLHWDF